MKLLTAACVAVSLLAWSAIGQVATFENFSEGGVGYSFLDPLSGILFKTATNNLGRAVFCVDYGGAAVLPPVLPGNYLTIGGDSPGPSIGLGAGPRFTFSLPAPSTRLEMDVLYGATSHTANLSLSAYASNGQLLFSRNETLPTGSGLAVFHAVLSSDTPMDSVFVGTAVAAGFDNIAVPEPACGSLLLLAGAGLFLKRARRFSTALH